MLEDGLLSRQRQIFVAATSSSFHHQKSGVVSLLNTPSKVIGKLQAAAKSHANEENGPLLIARNISQTAFQVRQRKDVKPKSRYRPRVPLIWSKSA